MRRLISVSALVLVCALAAACDDDAAPTTPIETPVEVSETFTGTLNVNSAVMHIFLTERAGQAVATLESLSPDSAAVVEFTFGTWNGNNCQVTLIKLDATTGANLVGTASAGTFCVTLRDIGRLAEPTTYSIKVTHF